MNDCFWGFINGVCECEMCNNCGQYISANSDEGRELLENYQLDVNKALDPVSEKWKQLKEKQNEPKTML